MSDVTGNFGQNSVVVLLLLFFAETLSQSQGSHGYELASPAVSLDCIKTHVFDGVSKVGCAIFASRMSLYNFGFVLLNETCMICRAGGTPRDPTVMETTIKGTLHVYECPRRVRLGGFGCYDIGGQTTWYESSQTCGKMGTNLLAIEFEDENNAIKSFLEENEAQFGLVTTGGHYGLGSSIWLGATDAANEGTFLWQPSGVPVTFDDWESNQPNDNGRGQDCVAYFHGKKKWHDVPCGLVIDMFICEG